MSTRPSYEYEDERKWVQAAGSDASPVSPYGDRPRATPSASEVLGEIGLVLVVILGIAVAINLVLAGLHIP